MKALSSSDFLTGRGPEPFNVTLANGEVGVVYQRELMTGDVLAFASTAENSPERTEAMVRMVAKAICNEQGDPLFGEAQLDEVRNMPIRLFEQLSGAVVEANGLSVDEGDEDSGNP